MSNTVNNWQLISLFSNKNVSNKTCFLANIILVGKYVFTVSLMISIILAILYN